MSQPCAEVVYLNAFLALSAQLVIRLDRRAPALVSPTQQFTNADLTTAAILDASHPLAGFSSEFSQIVLTIPSKASIASSSGLVAARTKSLKLNFR